MLDPGLYEELVTAAVDRELARLDRERLLVEPADLLGDPDLLIQHLARAIRHAVLTVRESAGPAAATEALQRRANHAVGAFMDPDDPAGAADLLLPLGGGPARLREVLPPSRNRREPTPRPITPLHRHGLSTGRSGVQFVQELVAEIPSATQVDILCAFIRMSGIRPLLGPLRAFVEAGGRLRVMTTTFTGSTELAALQQLSELPNTEVRVSYDTERTRLHAKAYRFHRLNGLGTAWIGSSNLSNVALTEGLEWNVRLAEAREHDLFQQMDHAFETFWADYGSEPFEPERFNRAIRDVDRPEVPRLSYVVDVHPFPHQAAILESLAAEREVHGRRRNLVVAATGTGKTVIAALDYRRYRESRPGMPSRLLFLAHRAEILEQSLSTFRAVLKDSNFGQLQVGGSQATNQDHLFASIQSWPGLDIANRLGPDFYDFVVIDEFHHGAAPTYQRALEDLQPDILLGLTATPERTDGIDVAEYFGGRYAAELRLPDALEQDLLAPFHYFGITDDTVDLSQLRWFRGRYDPDALERVISSNDVRARHVWNETSRIVGDVGSMKALAFCVSQQHAHFMAKWVNDHVGKHGIRALALDANSSQQDRDTARGRLTLPAGDPEKLHLICTVDLYNEGIDIPEVDTVLFLRPTESGLVFTQQLGRGLRKHPGKVCLTVLDFVAQQHRNFRWEERIKALTGSGRDPRQQVADGFPTLPPGCAVILDRVARDRIIAALRESWMPPARRMVEEIRACASELAHTPALDEYLDWSGRASEDVYGRRNARDIRTWTSLLHGAGLGPAPTDPDAPTLSGLLQRLLHVDDAPRIAAYQHALQGDSPVPPLASMLRRLLRDTVPSDVTDEPSFLAFLRRNPQLASEAVDLLDVLRSRIDLVPESPLGLPPALASIPLLVGAHYTREEVLAALGFWDWDRAPEQREGVLWMPGLNTESLFVTLQKSEAHFSPSTMYEDYVIDPWHFHWQSQGRTRADSETGRRYQQQRANGTTILLFVRRYRDAVTGRSAPFAFLGPVDFQSSRGSQPMSIVWETRHRIPQHLVDEIQEGAA